jgi:crossover junction endodeoxyribonuclease RuvC
MIVVGIDCGTHVGMAKVDTATNEIVGTRINFPKQTGFERLQLIANAVQRLVLVWEPSYIVVEGFAIYRASSAVTVVSVGTIVRKALYDVKKNWLEVPPSTLKKWVSGSGNASKEQMALAIKERFDYSSASVKADDIIDAVGLAKLGEYLAINGPDATVRGTSPGW